ncbi:zinc finger protein CONSTANS-LIKE 13 [Humulus lupulus]|uniref:zinc finger protein CONSTANS-LIKE 13 n=1 Tax=Humulus lupulus TaxID=3486 RepID=UPI002B40483A|nr:zinc finger protein CONSTANS-LIKE 13 [Humulus lupulus]XP_062087984.1 zinc finger protein CONSTANS-LIKE 13 [Humulus lupulus]XP_062087992.1 zinc finger protein CONSTANS-LIKE 13 [Humulus lupulus]XP_062087999.1 zinc finger protein CONSTANS-LIKE 13 [Humulus lupulus]XP_062088008.1 zinc finger protein CONSTANS-LIKE 13 [Humulus lupulus]
MDSQRRRICDYCNDATALLYCRADSAKLCFSCDLEVHGTNQLFTKHSRFQLCDACHDSPASIFCSSDSSVFCQNCDWERHKPSLSLVHDRRPLEGFNGCPSVSELLGILGFEDFDKKALISNEERDGSSGFQPDDFLDLSLWETPIVGLDDLIVSSSSHNFQAMGIPPLPKNRNAVCGQHKEEVIAQLRKLAKIEPNTNFDNGDAAKFLNCFESLAPEQSVQPGKICIGSQYDAGAEPVIGPTYETPSCQWSIDGGETADQKFLVDKSLSSHLKTSYRDFEKYSDIDDTWRHVNDDGQNEQPQHPISSSLSRALSDFHKVASYELTSQEREGAISRYKEKRKTRRYEKCIRYESRKVRAESRIRIKGRFAKIDH